MRKVRIWDKRNKKWLGLERPAVLHDVVGKIYGFYVLILPEMKVGFAHPARIKEIEGVEINNFIRMDDENKEVYENDIIEFNTNPNFNCVKGIVIYFPEGYYGVLLKGLEEIANHPGIRLWNIAKIKKIGNIYENPELLREEK